MEKDNGKNMTFCQASFFTGNRPQLDLSLGQKIVDKKKNWKVIFLWYNKWYHVEMGI